MARNPFQKKITEHPVRTRPFTRINHGSEIAPVGELPALPPKWSAPYLPRQVGFRVDGLPAPKGSKSYKGRRKNGSAILVESAAETLGPWSERVERAARLTAVRFAGPVEVTTEFIMPRPKRPAYPVHAVKPDGDKLTRAVWDALQVAGMIEQDSRVARWSGAKRFALPGEAVGAFITVREWRP